MKNNYINGMQQKLKEKINKIKSKTSIKDTLLMLGSVFLGISSFYCIFGLANLTLAGTFLTGTGVYNIYKNRRLNKKIIENLEKEKSHLESLKDKDPQDEPNLNKKRTSKYNSLHKQSKKIEGQYKGLNTATNIGSLTTAATAIGCGFLPGMWFVPPITMAITAILGNQAMKKNEETTNLSLRANNIKNDLAVISINRSTNRNNNTNTNANTNNNTNSNTNTNTNTNSNSNTNNRTNTPPLPPRNTQSTNQQSAYKKAVDSYVNKLAGFKKNYINRQKVKK